MCMQAVFRRMPTNCPCAEGSCERFVRRQYVKGSSLNAIWTVYASAYDNGTLPQQQYSSNQFVVLQTHQKSWAESTENKLKLVLSNVIFCNCATKSQINNIGQTCIVDTSWTVSGQMVTGGRSWLCLLVNRMSIAHWLFSECSLNSAAQS